MRKGRAGEIFQDAESLFVDSLEQLDAGKLRNAAEKAWGATLRATAALILARTGEEPERSDLTSRGLNALAQEDADVERRLVPRYYTRMGSLHGDCFYHGELEPRELLERRIRETGAYIQDARTMAG